MLREPAIPMPEAAARASQDGRSGGSSAMLAALNGASPAISFAPAATLMALMTTIERLEQVIDQETQELRKYRVADLGDFNRRKSQGLLELSRVMRGLGEAALDGRVQGKLAQLRSKLDANLSVLRMHLAAAQEVTAIISCAIQDAESDGTYSASLKFAER
jgi:hypothetical protein